jgi:hypothetical protein
VSFLGDEVVGTRAGDRSACPRRRRLRVAAAAIIVASVSVRRRRRLLLVAVSACAAAAVVAPADGAAAKVVCPASAAAAAATPAGPVQWAFSVLGAPSAGGAGASSSWTRGNGTWNKARASGTICSNDSGSAIPHRDLVLKVAGSSKLSPMITRLGLLGVGIVLAVTVSATDDAACRAGTRGTVTLFASYYSVHRDSIALHFSGGCADHDHTFTGSIVRVLITRNGAQVNAA